MDKIIKDRIDAIRQGRIPEGYNHIRYMVYPKDWVNHVLLILY